MLQTGSSRESSCVNSLTRGQWHGVMWSFLQLLLLILLIRKPVCLLALQCHLIEYSKTINISYITFPSHPLRRNTPLKSFRLSIGGSKIPSTLPLQNRNSPSRDRALSCVETMNLKNYFPFPSRVSSLVPKRLYVLLVRSWAAYGISDGPNQFIHRK